MHKYYVIAVLSLILAACSGAPERAPILSSSGVSQDSVSDGSKATPVSSSGSVASSPSSSPSFPNDDQGGDSPSNPASPVTPQTPSTSPVSPIPVTGGKAAAVPSPGCGKPASQALAKYIRKTAVGMSRVYDLYLPANYDAAKPHPLIILGHGCTGNSAPFKMESVSKEAAIIVGLKSAGSCFVYTMNAEGAYFDQVIKEVSADSCVDSARVFLAGFSSGSWLTNMLGCARAGVIRAQGNAAGGLPGLPTCTGPIAAMMVHDKNDTENVIAGGEKARDRILKVNTCSNETEPYDYDDNPATASVCVKYKGCKDGFPVVWCPTTGKGHNENTPITNLGLWKFWSQF